MAKEYTTSIRQQNQDAPIIRTTDISGNTNPLINTLGNIVWTREFVGIFYGTLVGAFPQDKTICRVGNSNDGSSPKISLRVLDTDRVILTTQQLEINFQAQEWYWVTRDNLLEYDTPIEIIVHHQ